MRKLTARWVSKSLSDEQMATRASVCSALLKRFRLKGGFLLCLVTVDETWAHYYEPENKASSRQWVRPGSPRPKKFKTQPSADKPEYFGTQKASLCWTFYSREVQYANSLVQLRIAIREKRRDIISKGVCCNRTTRESTLAKLQWML